MHKPRELKPRPRNFTPPGWKKFGAAKPEVQPAPDREDPHERPEAEKQRQVTHE
jgi:hypothetical protein